MPIGGRWPDPPAGTGFIGSPAGAAGPIDAAGQPVPGPPGGPRWFARTLSVVPGTVTVAGALVDALIATLPAPGPGVNYVLERLLVTTGQAPTSIRVFSGIQATDQTALDGIEAPDTGVLYVLADGDSAPRLGEQDQLIIAFVGLTAAAGELARVQVRMEPS